MKIKLNTHGTTAMFYRGFYNKEEVPGNLCAYFWKLIFAIIFTPFVYPALIVNKLLNPFCYKEKYKSYYISGGERMKTLWGIVLNLIIFFAGCFVSSWIFTKPMMQHMSFYKIYFNGFLAVAGLLFSIYFLIVLIRLIPRKEPKELSEEEYQKQYVEQREKEDKREAKWKRSFLYLCIQAFIAFKNKVCPIIEWENKK